MSKAYAYLRVSTKTQTGEDKDGLERQRASIRRIAQQHGVEFDDIQIYQDKGVSAYTGKNAEVGELKELIDDIENLDIKSGDVIFVEALDRLSRQKLLKTKSLFYDKILSKGVKIITTSDGAIYQDHDDPNEVFLQDVKMSVLVQRSWDESRIKSIRRKSAWIKAKSDISKPFNAHNPPYGIIYNNDKNCFEIDLEKQKELIELFTLLQDFGIKETVKRLSKNPNYRNWTNKLITNLFEYKYVLGLYKSQKRENGKKVFIEFVEGYYPQLVPNMLFNQAEKAMKERGSNKQYGAREKLNINIFRHCIKCDICGKTLILERQVNSSNKTYYYFNCSTNRNISNSCSQPRFRFDYVICAFLKKLEENFTFLNYVKNNSENVEVEYIESFNKRMEKFNDVFLELFSKDKSIEYSNKIGALTEDLLKKKRKYETLKNQLDAFFKDDVEELDPLFVKKLNAISGDIKEIETQIDVLEIKGKEEISGLNIKNIEDFINFIKSESGRLKINNFFIKNKIRFKVGFEKEDETINELRFTIFKDSKFIDNHHQPFYKDKPIFQDFGYKDVTDIINGI